jgi:molecular chaperone DnaJ
MNIRDCHRILKVPPEATLDEVKAAFRKLAFTLHPDLNPSPKAAEQFRELNEAYILLSRALKDEPGKAASRESKADTGPDAKARKAQAGKAYARGAAQSAGTQTGAKNTAGKTFHFREEEVLRDLLSDPFARQVFEDIYSQLKQGQSASRQNPAQPQYRQPSPPPRPGRRRSARPWPGPQRRRRER